MQSYIDYVMFHSRYRKNTSEAYLLKLLDRVYSIITNKYSISMPNNEIKTCPHILIEYSKRAIGANVWISMHQKMIRTLVEEVQE